ncbi:hypothetical protein X893_5975 [Burkholderia pseudomallei TSV 31]|nr:hypothetical protein X891_421 [Burkholderia pseudomallei TSV 43]KGV49320.1 hypothetical protein X893_5975 [Burkholderia pseudomallei TSV 31]
MPRESSCRELRIAARPGRPRLRSARAPAGEWRLAARHRADIAAACNERRPAGAVSFWGRAEAADGHARWTRPMDTPDGHARWTRPMDTPDGHARWTRPMAVSTPAHVCRCAECAGRGVLGAAWPTRGGAVARAVRVRDGRERPGAVGLAGIVVGRANGRSPRTARRSRARCAPSEKRRRAEGKMPANPRCAARGRRPLMHGSHSWKIH